MKRFGVLAACCCFCSDSASAFATIGDSHLQHACSVNNCRRVYQVPRRHRSHHPTGIRRLREKGIHTGIQRPRSLDTAVGDDLDSSEEGGESDNDDATSRHLSRTAANTDNKGVKVKTISRLPSFRRGGRRQPSAVARRRKRLPKWFRRLLVSSKFSSMFEMARSIHHGEVNGNNSTNIKTKEEAAESMSNIPETKEEEEKTTSPQRRLPGARILGLILSSPLVEFKMSLLVVLSSVFVAAGTVQSIPASVRSVINAGENIIAFLFLVEYLLRWYCNDLRLSHLIKPLVIVDFLSILPLAIMRTGYQSFGSKVLQDHLLVNLRLLRLLRFQRFLVDFDTFERFQMAVGFRLNDVRKYHLQLARVIITIFTLQTVSAGLIYAAEHVANPGLRDFPSAMYFVLTTVTTVGFGDITPVTAVGRMIVCATIFAGAAIIPLQLSSFVEALLDFRRDMEAKRLARKRTADPYLTEDEKAYELEDTMQPDGTYKKEKTKTLLACRVCDAKPHREKATFCWNCGSPLWAMRNNYAPAGNKAVIGTPGDTSTISATASSHN